LHGKTRADDGRGLRGAIFNNRKGLRWINGERRAAIGSRPAQTPPMVRIRRSTDGERKSDLRSDAGRVGGEHGKEKTVMIVAMTLPGSEKRCRTKGYAPVSRAERNAKHR
ncbi:MAG: hypothetical protein KI788_18115, partial [Mameliella sp.]|nr:hypothetical protein [Mameliella sp.]